MAGSLFNKFTSKIRSALRLRPVPPKLTPEQLTKQRIQSLGGVAGDRGIAAGSLTPGKQDFSAENVAKWRKLSDEVGIGFVFESQPFFVHSSNLVMAQYFQKENKMSIEFKNGAVYLYNGISEQEAISFYIAMSKGGWTWDNIRVRGKGNFWKTKKSFVKIKGGSNKGHRKKAKS